MVTQNPLLERTSASLPALASLSSDPLTNLTPATSLEFRRELTACLALVGAVGMDEAGRKEWLTVAWGTLKDMPSDLLERGCAHARLVCDHPSKLVPAIMEEVRKTWEWRKQASHPHPSAPQIEAPKPENRPHEKLSDSEEVNALLVRVGAVTRYRPDGTRYEAETASSIRETRGPPRKPTRQDYIELGVDPATIDTIMAEKHERRPA